MNLFSTFESKKKFNMYNSYAITHNYAIRSLDVSVKISSFYKVYAEINLLSENSFRENKIFLL